MNGDSINSIWLVIGSLCAFAVAYRLYGAFLAAKVAMLDDSRKTPAHRLKDGVDYHPTNKLVLFGHHFAAIAGPGPLVGPVIAAQWGYLPGFVWIVIGACLAGAVHDFVILWASVREDGLTLPKIASRTIGPLSGVTTSIATLFIIVTSLASVGSVVVHALSHSAWGMFTIIVTIPAALLTGLWMYKIRPGKVYEASAIGVTIVMLGVILGRPFAESGMGQFLVFEKSTLSIILPAYALIASILPVWVLMCPRDYLSSYMKIGVMIVLAAGLIIAHPELKMPAITPYVDGGGPVYAGKVWPFVCIVIMCGAISGFHSLIASGTTPKMINKESDIRVIGYGAMVLEGFVAVTALIAACALNPGDYFIINSPAANYQKAVAAAAKDESFKIDMAPKELAHLEKETEEKLAGRPGGAVTLAVGMAKVFSSLPGMDTLMSYWYHFVIMFEALFILTLLETGTRVGRFIFQETFTSIAGERQVRPSALETAAGVETARAATAEVAPARGGIGSDPNADGDFPPPGQPVAKPRWGWNILMSVVVCSSWGYLLYSGSLDTLWRMLGIANQLLASIALAVGTTYLLLHAPKRAYALCTAIPFFVVVVTTFFASVLSIQVWWASIPAIPPEQSNQIFMTQLVCVIAGIMLVLSAIICIDAVRRWISILTTPSAVVTPALGGADGK